MAMAASNGAGANRRRSRRGGRRNAPMSEINVTPMVDVMLVLLIVFMVAAPLSIVGVPIDLPETQASTLNTEAKPITLTVTTDGQIFLGDELIALEDVIASVEAATDDTIDEPTEQRIYLRGDAQANYGAVMEVMGVLSGAGYSRIGLITEQQQGQ